MTDFDPIAFWLDPQGSGETPGMVATCVPEFYLPLDNVTRLHVETMRKYARPGDVIMELGCGTGRNLAGLLAAGFCNVRGIELNPKAVELGRSRWPELENVPIEIGPLQTTPLPPCDVIFTSGVLMHIPPQDEELFARIRQAAGRVIVTVEGEQHDHRHVWSRNYRQVFECRAWLEVEKELCGAYPPLPNSSVKRVFVKQ